MKIISRAVAATVVTAGVALAVVLSPTAAMAATTPPPPDNSPAKLAQITVAPTGPNVSSLSFAQSAPSTTSGLVISPSAERINSGTLSATGTKIITPPGGSRGGLYDAFTSAVTVTSTYTKLGGSSQGVWEGSVPTNASKIALLDSISTTGLFVSFSVGPVGVDFGHTADSWTYSTSVANNYNIKHSYSGLQFGGAVLTVSESSQVTATFGSSSYAQITN